MYRGAMRSIFSELFVLERLIVVEAIDLSSPKTKDLVARLKGIKCRTCLDCHQMIHDANLLLAARNLPNVDVCTAADIDPVGLIAI